jgi:methyl-accepting chemotaxis protein
MGCNCDSKLEELEIQTKDNMHLNEDFEIINKDNTVNHDKNSNSKEYNNYKSESLTTEIHRIIGKNELFHLISDKNVTINVDELGSFSEEMANYTEAAMSALEELMAQNAEVVRAMSEISSQIQATNDAVKSIADASGLITDISGQTNLLSLNASIEAARAGEAGRGFAVVATEIGQLANQSEDAAKKINEIVDNLVTESERSVRTVAKLQEDFERQNEKIDATKSDMESMSNGVANVTDSAEKISERVRSLNDAKNELLTIINALAGISESNAASTEETNASMQELNASFTYVNEASQELKAYAKNLEEQLEFFKLQDK